MYYIQPLSVFPVIFDFPLSEKAGDGVRAGELGGGGSRRAGVGERERERDESDLAEPDGERVSFRRLPCELGVDSLAFIDPALLTSVVLGFPLSVFLSNGGLTLGMGVSGRFGILSARLGVGQRSPFSLMTSSGSSMIGERTRTLLISIRMSSLSSLKAVLIVSSGGFTVTAAGVVADSLRGISVSFTGDFFSVLSSTSMLWKDVKSN